ncbi:MAG: spiro-SPASM protein [Treponema sp.]|nr:spiro-SPASM protein [Treponema sp.]
MNSILILYAGSLTHHAFREVLNGKNALQLSIEQAAQFPGVNKIALFCSSNVSGRPENLTLKNSQEFHIEQRDTWTKRSVLEKTAELQEDFDLAYFAFADCPFLDPVLAGNIADRHLRFAAEYSYADGWPYGLAPEILSKGTAAILVKILGDNDGPVERDMLFSVIQKDINAFDIETEVSSVDLRCHRINLCADSKRNVMLLNNFLAAGNGKIPSASDVERIVAQQPEILRTLPSFFPIQVYGGCPQKCIICPYPSIADQSAQNDYMDCGKFETLLDNIIDFSQDAVIDLSLWGELSLHPEKMKLIKSVLTRGKLALIIETSGIGWKNEELEECAQLAKTVNGRINVLSPLSWIVSLDTTDSKRYTELRTAGFAEAESCARKLLSLFPNDCYVQAVRLKGSEDDTEKFYRYWKDASPNGEKNIIIQKYDDFCGHMERKQASDISPVIRQCCWHIMRDFPVLTDGTVPLCRENLAVFKGDKNMVLGNVFTDSIAAIWQNGEKYYKEQCKRNYSGLCENCDEYYTYNF